jgi:YesN/AraC family two-component response regulator
MSSLLIVDDEPMLLKMLKWQLETMGHQVITAASGYDALTLLSERTIDLVLTDLRMPKMDGHQLVHQIREKGWQLPCIVMTGHGDLDLNQHKTEFEVDEYLFKPLKLNELQNVIARSI